MLRDGVDIAESKSNWRHRRDARCHMLQIASRLYFGDFNSNCKVLLFERGLVACGITLFFQSGHIR